MVPNYQSVEIKMNHLCSITGYIILHVILNEYIYKQVKLFLFYDASCNECRVCKLFLNDLMFKKKLFHKKGIFI